MKARKRIPVDKLKPGMFVVGMDQPWYKTPYLLHHFLVQSTDTVTELIRYGVREVSIDPSKGLDVTGDGQPNGQEAMESSSASSSAGTASGSASHDDLDSARTKDGTINRIDHRMYQEAEAAIERIFEDVGGGGVPSLPAVKTIVGRFFSRVLQDPTAMMTQVMLQQMRRFDRSLASHAIDTSILSLIFASAYGIAPDEMEEIGIGALLHDIGYVRLPRNLYRARRQLALHEEELLQQHPRLGHTMLAEARDLSDLVRRIVLEHHERIDGSGYPSRSTGSALSPAGQLVGLVDTYQALVTFRAGHIPLPPFQAVRNLFMLGEKRTFDKALVEAAIKCLGVYPIGSVVKLSTGERAVVVGVHPEHRLKPSLKVIIGPRGEYYPTPVELDLAEPGKADPKPTILTALDPATEQINVAMYLDASNEEQAA